LTESSERTERKMELFQINAGQQPEDPELMALAARIRPLPKNILPSARFVEQTRHKLLNLDARRAQAA
jgi:hypothetical protein